MRCKQCFKAYRDCEYYDCGYCLAALKTLVKMQKEETPTQEEREQFWEEK